MNGIVRRIDRTQFANAGSPTLEQTQTTTGMQSLGQGLTDVGGMLDTWQDEIDTADAQAADTEFTSRVNDLLYNDQNGFMYEQGGNAISRRQAVAEQLETWQSEFLADLSPSARARAETSLTARYQSALQRVNERVGTERRSYLNDTAQARINNELNTAAFDPSNAETHIQVALDTMHDIASREGWSEEQVIEAGRGITSEGFSNIITRQAQTDPRGALSYLEDNRDRLSAEDATRLENALRPMALEAEGRELGAAAAIGSEGMQGYLRTIRSTESGGNDQAANPLSSALGRYQFLSGTWQEMMRQHPDLGLTVDGRTDPEQQERAIARFTQQNARSLVAAGIPVTGGNLYAAHFFGAGGAVNVLSAAQDAQISSIVSLQVMEQNPFLRDMTVRDFQRWSNERHGAGVVDVFGQEQQSPLDRLVAIEDPEVREAALREYELRSDVAERQEREAREAAQTSVLTMIEGGGSTNDLDVETRQLLGPEIMQAARAYERSVASGIPVQTDDQFYVNLRRQMDDDPQAFMQANPMEWRNSLDDGQFRWFTEAQSQMRAGTRGGDGAPDVPSVSTMMSEADSALRAAGVTDSDNPAARDRFQSAFVRWADANPQMAANPVERQRQRAVLLSNILLSDGRNQEGRLFEFDMGGQTASRDDDLRFQDVSQQIRLGTLYVNDQQVSQDVMNEVMFDLTAAINGYPRDQALDLMGDGDIIPTTAQIMQALAAYYQ